MKAKNSLCHSSIPWTLLILSPVFSWWFCIRDGAHGTSAGRLRRPTTSHPSGAPAAPHPSSSLPASISGPRFRGCSREPEVPLPFQQPTYPPYVWFSLFDLAFKITSLGPQQGACGASPNHTPAGRLRRPTPPHRFFYIDQAYVDYPNHRRETA